MKRIAWKVIPFILMIIFISPKLIFAEKEISLEDRIRQSGQFREISDFQREAAVLTLEKPLRLQPSMIELRAQARALMTLDHTRFRWLREKGIIKEIIVSPHQKTLEAFIDYLIPYLDDHLESLFKRCEENERKMGGALASSALSDDQLFQVLTQLSIFYSQIIILYDYRTMVMADLQALINQSDWAKTAQAHHPKSEIRDWVESREPLNKKIFLQKVEIDKQGTIYQTIMLVLEKILAKKEIQEELDYYRIKQKQVGDLIKKFKGPKKATSLLTLVTIQKLMDERLESLQQQLPSENNDTPLPSSSILVPMEKESVPPIHPLISEWRQIKRELIQSVNLKSAKFAALVPKMKERNATLRKLREIYGSDPSQDFLLPDFLIRQEEELLDLFSHLWRRIDPKVQALLSGDQVDHRVYADLTKICIVLEVLYPFDLQLLASMERFVKKISSPHLIPVEKLEEVSRGLNTVSLLLKEMEKDFHDFVQLTDKEEAIWARFDEFLARIVGYRPKVWEAWQSVWNEKDAGYDPLGLRLKGAIKNKKSGNELDSKTFLDLTQKAQNDPVIKILYGRPKNRSWNYTSPIADFVHQTLNEIIGRNNIIKNLQTASSSAEKDDKRALALESLVNPLLFSWNLVFRDSSLDLSIKIDDRPFMIKSINKIPHLDLTRAFRNYTKMGNDFWDFVLFPKSISGQGVTSVDPTSVSPTPNIPTVPQVSTQPRPPGYFDYLSNQMFNKNIITYGILGTGMAVATGVSVRSPATGAIIAKGVGAALATQAVIDTSMSGGHMAADRLIKDPQLRYTAHNRIQTLETTLYAAQVVNGLANAGAAAKAATKTLNQAEQAYDAAKQGLQAAESSKEGIAKATAVVKEGVANNLFSEATQAAGKGNQAMADILVEQSDQLLREGVNATSDAAQRVSEAKRVVALAQGDVEAAKKVLTARTNVATSSGELLGDVIGESFDKASSSESFGEGISPFGEGYKGPKSSPPQAGSDRASQLRSAENQTASAQPSGTDAANLQPALNTNVTGSFQQGMDQQRQQDSRQTLGTMGGTQAERAAAAQDQQMRDQSRVQAQGQQTTQAISSNAQEFVNAQQTLQGDRQNSIGNLLFGALMGGLTSGVAIGLDQFFGTVGIGAGQQVSTNWGLKPPPPPPGIITTGPPGTQTTVGQTGPTPQTTTSTGSPTPSPPPVVTPPKPAPSPPPVVATSCRTPGTCTFTQYADKNGCCSICGKRVAGK